MPRTEYHELYGWMPQSVIDSISTKDRMLLFMNWLGMKPTYTGRVIVNAVVKELGDEFLEYMLKDAICALQYDGELSKENAINLMKDMLDDFATDVNLLYEYVKNYHQDYLGISNEDSDEPEFDGAGFTAEDNHPVENTKKSGPRRDPLTGKFMKAM